MKRILYILILILILIAGCSKNKIQMSTEEKLQKADELFANKKYARAAQLYEEITFERQSAATSRAMMRQAESYFNMNKFVDARLKYLQFTQLFPSHQDVATAYFRIGVCYFEESLPTHYDQTETNQAIETFKLFIDKFPNDSRFTQALEYIRKSQYKLLEKRYHNGYIYYRMSDYSGALMYFNEIIELGNQDQLDKMALYYATLIQLRQGLNSDARASFEKMKAKYPGAKETRKLSRRF